MRALFRAHSAGSDACAFASGAGVGVVTVAAVAEELACAKAVRTPVGIIDLFFEGFGAVFDLVTGVVAVFFT